MFLFRVMIAENKCYTQCSTPLQTPNTCQVISYEVNIIHCPLNIPVTFDYDETERRYRF